MVLCSCSWKERPTATINRLGNHFILKNLFFLNLIKVSRENITIMISYMCSIFIDFLYCHGKYRCTDFFIKALLLSMIISMITKFTIETNRKNDYQCIITLLRKIVYKTVNAVIILQLIWLVWNEHLKFLIHRN